MCPDELKLIQKRLELSNNQLAHLLNCSISTIDSYRSNDSAWSRPIPNSIAGLLRIIEMDYNNRKRHQDAHSKWYRDNKSYYVKYNEKKRKNKKLSNDEAIARNREYRKCYARYRRGDLTAMDEFYKKFKRRRSKKR